MIPKILRCNEALLRRRQAKGCLAEHQARAPFPSLPPTPPCFAALPTEVILRSLTLLRHRDVSYSNTENATFKTSDEAATGKLDSKLSLNSSLIISRRKSTVVWHFQLNSRQRLQAQIHSESLTNASSIAHTISQRLRTLKKIPPELMPLGEHVLTIPRAWANESCE